MIKNWLFRFREMWLQVEGYKLLAEDYGVGLSTSDFLARNCSLKVSNGFVMHVVAMANSSKT